MPKVRWAVLYRFCSKFHSFSAVQKLWKSVKIWQSYWEFQGGNFFWDTVHNNRISRTTLCLISQLSCMAELIKSNNWSSKKLSMCVCLDVNQGGTNRSHCTQRLVILHAQKYWWTPIKNQKKRRNTDLYVPWWRAFKVIIEKLSCALSLQVTELRSPNSHYRCI